MKRRADRQKQLGIASIAIGLVFYACAIASCSRNDGLDGAYRGVGCVYKTRAC